MFNINFLFRDLILEDWRDFVAAFYFPKMHSVIEDEKIKDFVEKANAELTEPN